jgi:hypothetical protein
LRDEDWGSTKVLPVIAVVVGVAAAAHKDKGLRLVIVEDVIAGSLV